MTSAGDYADSLKGIFNNEFFTLVEAQTTEYRLALGPYRHRPGGRRGGPGALGRVPCRRAGTVKAIKPSEAIRRAYQCLTVAFQRANAPLTLPKAAVLRALIENGPLTQAEIGAKAAIDRATGYELLQRMATDKQIANVTFVESGRPPRKRQGGPVPLLVTITPAGRTALNKTEDAILFAEAEMMRLVPGSDRAGFLRAMRAIANGAPE